jgi:hypothetical protein
MSGHATLGWVFALSGTAGLASADFVPVQDLRGLFTHADVTGYSSDDDSITAMDFADAILSIESYSGAVQTTQARGWAFQNSTIRARRLDAYANTDVAASTLEGGARVAHGRAESVFGLEFDLTDASLVEIDLIFGLAQEAAGRFLLRDLTNGVDLYSVSDSLMETASLAAGRYRVEAAILTEYTLASGVSSISVGGLMSFRMEIVPAPGGTIVMALGALAFKRRRD